MSFFPVANEISARAWAGARAWAWAWARAGAELNTHRRPAMSSSDPVQAARAAADPFDGRPDSFASLLRERAHELVPDYPFMADENAFEWLWAITSALEGTDKACGDWAEHCQKLEADVADLTRERDRLRQSNRDFADTLAAANAHLVRVAGERDRLRAALAPFAAMLNNKVAGGGLVSDLKDSEEFVAGVLVCDIRRAVEVLAPPAADAGGGRG
jgi:hypothetical protein